MTPLKRTLRALAWSAVILSFPVWGAAFLVPFLPLSVAARAGVAAGCVAAGELLFWAGGLYLGGDVIARFRARKAQKTPLPPEDG